MCTFNQTRNVSNRESSAWFSVDCFGQTQLSRIAAITLDYWPTRILIKNNRADIGLQRCKGPIAHSSTAVCDGTKEGTFSSIRKADEADVSKELELKLNLHGNSLFTFGSKHGPRMRPRCEVGVAQTTNTSSCEKDWLWGRAR